MSFFLVIMESDGTTTKQKLWEMLKKKHFFQPPLHIKNILKYSNFDDIHSLQEIARKDEEFPFEEVVPYVQSQDYKDAISEQGEISDDEKRNYYGMYYKNPENFKFNPGEKRLLNHLVYIMSETEARSLQRFSEKTLTAMPEANFEHDRRDLGNKISNVRFSHNLNNDASRIQFTMQQDGSANVHCPKCPTDITVKKHLRDGR